MRRSITTRAIALALLAASAAPALAATNIDTTGASSDAFHPFGTPTPGSTPAYGQTFTVGSDNVLNSFSMYLVDYGGAPSSSPIDFTAYIYAWDGSKATGSALYTSSTQSFSGSLTPTEYVFNTGSLALTSGSQYVAFLFANSGNSAGMPIAGTLGNDAYNGGSFVFYNTTNFSDLTTNSWDGASLFSPTDAWFKAAFNAVGAVPEPGSWALMLLGFAGVGVALRRDRKRTSTALA